jgi:hypothetical protein
VIDSSVDNSKLVKTARGWEVEVGGFNVVMYGPVKVFNGKNIPCDNYGAAPSEAMRVDEHGPCHVHVFDKKNGYETRFELIEHYKKDSSFARPLHMEKRKNMSKKSLSIAQIHKVQALLQPLANDLIQCWREMYQDNSISNYVARVSKKKNGMDVIQTMQSDGLLETEKPKTYLESYMLGLSPSGISRVNMNDHRR